MTIRFSFHTIADDLGALVREARVVEEAGFDHLWLGESHLAFRDVNVALTLYALNTSRIAFGPVAMSPVLHDSSMIASRMATLNELAPGRILVGLGSGDTPVYSLGKKLASLATMRQTVQRVRSLVRGETVDYDGVEVAITWARHALPIFLAAEGPRTLQLAGEVADGVTVGSGVHPDTIAWAEGHLRQGVQRRDASLGELDVTYAVICCVDTDGQVARDRARARVGNRAHHNFRRTLESVPLEHRADVQVLMRDFDIRHFLAAKHGALISDYLLDRFAVYGTPEQCVARIKELERLGVTRLCISLSLRPEDRSLELFIRDVMPRCR
jgi:5,10-methylenetetrahydromethanopterin reductase